ncbi:hypothetical protein J9303_13860 [Bacillaceae bacterium Marseille-Q3522]|nr:hypothetical protein [Bacillaceae bacterium Marseille-Q3522]
MEIGGLVAFAFQIVFGNPDVMVLILSAALFFSIALVSQKVYEELRGE